MSRILFNGRHNPRIHTANVDSPRAVRGFLTSDFSLAQAFMPGKTGTQDFVGHALSGRNDLGDRLGPLKQADDYFLKASRTQA
jgi:hypothetical protein